MTHLRMNFSSIQLKTLMSNTNLHKALEQNEQFAYFHSLVRWITIFVELSIGYIATIIAHRLYAGDWEIAEASISAYVFFGSMSWVFLTALRNLYQQRNILNFRYFLTQFPLILFLHIGLVWAFTVSIGSVNYPLILLSWDILLTALLVFIFRFFTFIFYKYRRFLLERRANILVVGNSPEARELFSYLRSIKTRVFSLAESEKAHLTLGWDAPENLARIKDFCIKQQVNELIIAQPFTDNEKLEKLQAFADDHYIYLKLLGEAKVLDTKDNRYVYLNAPQGFDILNTRQAEINFFGSTPMITLRKQPLKTILNRFIKRSFDIVFSLFAILCVLIPVYMIVGTLIRFESRGSIIFRQARAGRKNRRFTCYKFRTMYQRPKEQDFKQATKNDPRITKVGAFLRKTSIDELPQLVNVLLGDMSMVGPRPHPLKLNDQYAPLIDRYHYRHFTTPGITGWAQVHGYRGETKDPYLMQKRVEYDQWYIENWSFWLDVKIIFLTMWKVVQRDPQAY